MLSTPPGVTSEMPVAQPDQSPLAAVTPPVVDDAAALASGADALAPDASPATDDAAPAAVTPPVGQEPATTQPATPPPPAQPTFDPAILPWGQRAATLLQQQQHTDSEIARLEAEQAAADRATQNLLLRATSEEAKQQIVQDYYAERGPREQQWHGLTAKRETLQSEDQMLGTEYMLWQRERAMERAAGPMAMTLLVDKTAQESGDPNFPKADMLAYMKGFPPNVAEYAAEQFKQFHAKTRLAARDASGVDRMGPAATAASPSWEGRSGYELIRESLLER